MPQPRAEWENGLREALRWPKEMDVLAPDMDSRSSMERALDFVEKLLSSEYESGKESGYELRDKEYAHTLAEVEERIRREVLARYREKVEKDLNLYLAGLVKADPRFLNIASSILEILPTIKELPME